jgi:hypothetical protein
LLLKGDSQPADEIKRSFYEDFRAPLQLTTCCPSCSPNHWISFDQNYLSRLNVYKRKVHPLFKSRPTVFFFLFIFCISLKLSLYIAAKKKKKKKKKKNQKIEDPNPFFHFR